MLRLVVLLRARPLALLPLVLRVPRLALRLLVLPLVSACNVVPWSAGEIDEAFRLCRAEVGFPPISVFEGAERGYGSYMCRCEVDYLAGRVATLLLNPFQQ